MNTLGHSNSRLRPALPNTETEYTPTTGQPDTIRNYPLVVSDPADRRPADMARLRSQHPELDWDDPDGAAETLAILGDPEAMAELEEAEHDIATGNVVPLDRAYQL